MYVYKIMNSDAIKYIAVASATNQLKTPILYNACAL